jgi:ABC-2 type transport system permease protein
MPVFDQGYQHWSGTTSSHAWRWLAITRHGLRVALQGRALRRVLMLSWMPSLALAGLLCVWGLLERKSSLIQSLIEPLQMFLGPTIIADPREYRVDVWRLCFTYFMSVELIFSMVLILIVGPNLISQDLRYNALPLYLSRPLKRRDYFLGKLGVIVALLGMVIVVPPILAYVLGLLFSLDLTIFRDTFGILLAAIAYGLVIAVSAGLLVLALSSLSRNSRYIALFWLGIWVVSSTVSGVLQSVEFQQQRYRMWEMERRGEDFEQWKAERAKQDWRPLVSYTNNLSRLGQELLGTNATWERLANIRLGGNRIRPLERFMGPRYPWQWSAAVLAGLGIISIVILNLSVKSLDRLK